MVEDASNLFFAQVGAYFSILFSPTDSRTVICEMAIWFSFCNRSDRGTPSLIRTEFKDSMLERQINWFTEA